MRSPVPLAFVSGAGIRVGRAIALEFARSGYDVICHAHASLDGANATAQDISALGRRAHVVRADLADADAVDALGETLVATHDTLDVVVHNAAIFEERSFEDINRAAYRRMQAINVEAPFFLTQALLPALRRAEAPSVIAVVDIAGERPIKRHAHYCISKAALSMMLRSLALEIAPIRVNGVAPGAVAFPADYDENKRARILARVPLAREGTMSDVARAVRFLAENQYITGQILAVDGGRGVTL